MATIEHSELSARLAAWANRRGGSRGELAKKISTALSSREDRGRWSLINIRREFDARDTDRGWLGVLVAAMQVVQVLSYLVPIGFTWLELYWSVRAFRTASANMSKQGGAESLNFLEFWSGGSTTSPYAGTTLDEVGIRILWIVLGIAVVSILVRVLEAIESHSDGELDDLIIEVQLAVATARTITPEDLADVLSDSAGLLDRAVGNMTTAVQSTSDAIKAIGDATTDLRVGSEAASRGLVDAASTLEKQVASLSSTLREIAQVADSLTGAGSSVAEAGRVVGSLGTASQSAVEAAGHLGVLVSSLSTASQELAQREGQLLDAFRSYASDIERGLGSAVDQTRRHLGEVATELSKAAGSAAETTAALRGLQEVSIEGQPQVAYLGDVVLGIDKVVKKLDELARDIIDAATAIRQSSHPPDAT
jgi:methyl-accepting chemotaxis protein